MYYYVADDQRHHAQWQVLLFLPAASQIPSISSARPTQNRTLLFCSPGPGRQSCSKMANQHACAGCDVPLAMRANDEPPAMRFRMTTRYLAFQQHTHSNDKQSRGPWFQGVLCSWPSIVHTSPAAGWLDAIKRVFGTFITDYCTSVHPAVRMHVRVRGWSVKFTMHFALSGSTHRVIHGKEKQKLLYYLRLALSNVQLDGSSADSPAAARRWHDSVPTGGRLLWCSLQVHI